MTENINQALNTQFGVTSGSQTPGNLKNQQARQTAEEFEAFFLSQMFNSMSSGLKTDGAFGGGHSEKIFRDMLNDEYAKSMSRQGGVGIADMVYREILALQEV